MIKIDNITASDIDATLKTTTIAELNKSYVERHHNAYEENDKVNKKALDDFGENTEVLYQKSECHYRNEVIQDMIIINNYSDDDEKRQFASILKSLGYVSESELVWINYYINKYLAQKMDYQELLKYLRGFKSLKSINETWPNTFELKTKFGVTTFVSAQDLQQFSYDERKKACHAVVGTALRTWDKTDGIYGAYYNLPLNFVGGFDHSVLYDEKNDTIIDLTNNVIIPYKFYKKVFGNPNFIISPKHFNELDRKMNSEYCSYITMDTIEEIRRIRKK